MIWKAMLEGVGLGVIMVVICAIGIRDGAVNMVQLYNKDVQDRCMELGLTTAEKIKKQSTVFTWVSLLIYLVYVLGCVYGINSARGFPEGFWNIFVILSVMNLIDRFLIDEYWVLHTKAWIIEGTEDLMPYINTKNKIVKWLMGTVGMAVISAIISGMMTLFLK